MILVTVFKDRERYEKDLHKAFNKIRATNATAKYDDMWDLAKSVTSKVDFTQKVHVSPAFFEGKKQSEIKSDIYAIGHDIAQGRRFKAKSSLYV